MAESTAVPVCPRCGAAMALRHRRSDDEPFWGCSRFPDCRQILKVAFAGVTPQLVMPPSPRQISQLGVPQTTRSASRFHRPGWVVASIDVAIAICAVAVAIDGRLAMMALGGILLAMAAVSILTATVIMPRDAAGISLRLLGLALLSVFAVYGLVPISTWIGQTVGAEMLREIPTLTQHTPSMVP
jgi:hypothetical protein